MADAAPRQGQRRVGEGAAKGGSPAGIDLVEWPPAPQYTNLFLEPDLPPIGEPE